MQSLQVNQHTYTHECTHACAHAHTHTRTHTHTHTHTHTYTPEHTRYFVIIQEQTYTHIHDPCNYINNNKIITQHDDDEKHNNYNLPPRTKICALHHERRQKRIRVHHVLQTEKNDVK